jgi:hypothetical protein
MHVIRENDATANTNVKTECLDCGQCGICADYANGIHYGVPTCEGCKGFFKRSISKHHTYACYLGKQCAMTLKGRKNGKDCRWISCLKAGMIYDGKQHAISFNDYYVSKLTKLKKNLA